nr:MAG TPA: hypothetical protein [Caudoviricetes sp.]
MNLSFPYLLLVVKFFLKNIRLIIIPFLCFPCYPPYKQNIFIEQMFYIFSYTILYTNQKVFGIFYINFCK